LILYYFIRSLTILFYRQLNSEDRYKKNIMRIYDLTKTKEWAKKFCEIKKIEEYMQKIKIIKQNV
jgi:hypothetical protein